MFGWVSVVVPSIECQGYPLPHKLTRWANDTALEFLNSVQSGDHR